MPDWHASNHALLLEAKSIHDSMMRNATFRRELRLRYLIAFTAAIAIHAAALALVEVAIMASAQFGSPPGPTGDEVILLNLVRESTHPVETPAPVMIAARPANVPPPDLVEDRQILEPLPAPEPEPVAPGVSLEPAELSRVPVRVPTPIPFSETNAVAPVPMVPAPGSAAPPQADSPGMISAARTPPLRLYNPKPGYPPAALRRGLEGTVELELNIDERGTVTDVHVSQSSGHSILDREAVKTARKWRFVPARVNGIPVRTNTLQPVRFQVED